MVCVRHCYPDAYRLFTTILPRFDIQVEFVDGRDVEAVERVLPGASALYLESPTSVVFETQDLARLAAAARAQGAVSIADNSWASPIFQRPLAHGVDLVVHSASKYLGGHSDVVAGVVCGRRELIERIDPAIFPLLGAKLAPFEGWLLVRGLRTLPLRMRRHQESGLAIAKRLAGHPRVSGSIIRCSRPRPGADAGGRRPACSASSSAAARATSRRSAMRSAVQARGQLGRAREPGFPGGGRSGAERRGQPAGVLRRAARDRPVAYRSGRPRRSVVRSRAARSRLGGLNAKEEAEMTAFLRPAAWSRSAPGAGGAGAGAARPRCSWSR